MAEQPMASKPGAPNALLPAARPEHLAGGARPAPRTTGHRTQDTGETLPTTAYVLPFSISYFLFRYSAIPDSTQQQRQWVVGS
jgi:hypothetical protein